MVGIRHYFAVICKAFDSFYKGCAGVFESHHYRISSSSPAIHSLQGPSLSVVPIDAMRDTRFGAMERRALFGSGKDARNVGSGVEEVQ